MSRKVCPLTAENTCVYGMILRPNDKGRTSVPQLVNFQWANVALELPENFINFI